MPNQDQNNERALAALLEHVDQERRRRRDAILEAAEEEARQLLHEGWREARGHLHEAVEQQRRERHSRLRSAQATEETRLREREHAIVRERLDQAWQALIGQLEQHWRSAEGRRCWLEALLQSAARHLPAGEWRLEYADGCETTELVPALEALQTQRPDVRVEHTGASELEAGFRIRAGAATLDGSRAALLARDQHVRGLLLGSLAATGGLPERPRPQGDPE